MKSHASTRQFTCHAVGCKSRGIKGFYRLDKLDQHIRVNHDANTLWICPDPDCTTEPKSSKELISHIKPRLSDFTNQSLHHKILLRVSIPVLYNCPFTDCPILTLFPSIRQEGRDIESQLEEHLHLEHCCKNARGFSKVLLSKELGYPDTWSHERLKEEHGICPICQTDMMAWKGHDMGDHMRQTHGPDAIQACAEKIRNMGIFSCDGLPLSNFIDQFPDLLREEEVKYLSEGIVLMYHSARGFGEYQNFPASLRRAALEKGWVDAHGF